MAQSQQSQTATSSNKIKTLKQCICGATVFQGPFPVGEIVNGEMVPRRQEYRCVNCNKVQTIDQMVDRDVTPVI